MDDLGQGVPDFYNLDTSPCTEHHSGAQQVPTGVPPRRTGPSEPKDRMGSNECLLPRCLQMKCLPQIVQLGEKDETTGAGTSIAGDGRGWKRLKFSRKKGF